MAALREADFDLDLIGFDETELDEIMAGLEGFGTSASPTDHPASAVNGRFVRNRGLGALHCESPLSPCVTMMPTSTCPARSGH